MSENSDIIWDAGDYSSLILKGVPKIKKGKKNKTQHWVN